MSKIILKGSYAVVPKDNFNCEDIFNNTNCNVIYKADQTYQSWIPGREINNFDTIEKGVGYIFVSKGELDVSSWFVSAEDITPVIPSLTIVNNSKIALELYYEINPVIATIQPQTGLNTEDYPGQFGVNNPKLRPVSGSPRFNAVVYAADGTISKSNNITGTLNITNNAGVLSQNYYVVIEDAFPTKLLFVNNLTDIIDINFTGTSEEFTHTQELAIGESFQISHDEAVAKYTEMDFVIRTAQDATFVQMMDGSLNYSNISLSVGSHYSISPEYFTTKDLIDILTNRL